jgi:D-amino-acid dehydrogenase
MRVAIVGAGVLGASTAFHLSLAGTEVVLADQGLQGRATAAGAGVICPWSSDRLDTEWYHIAVPGARYYPKLMELLTEVGEQQIGYRQSGALQAAFDPVERDRIEQLVRECQTETPEAGAISHLSRKDARRLFPPLHHNLAAVHIAGAARVDGRLLNDALCNAARRHGAQIVNGPAGVLVQAGRIFGITVGCETVEADHVVITAGAWAPALLAPLGIRLPVSPQRGQISHLRPNGTDTHEWPIALPPGSHYLLAFDDSRVVVGATRETGSGFDSRVTAAGQEGVLREAIKIAPGLGSATLIETRIGFRPVGPGIRPTLGFIDYAGGRLFVGNGLGPSGLTIGPYAGRLLAQAVAGEVTEMALAPDDPLRIPDVGAAADHSVR